jgi:hypothetical protein
MINPILFAYMAEWVNQKIDYSLGIKGKSKLPTYIYHKP